MVKESKWGGWSTARLRVLLRLRLHWGGYPDGKKKLLSLKAVISIYLACRSLMKALIALLNWRPSTRLDEAVYAKWRTRGDYAYNYSRVTIEHLLQQESSAFIFFLFYRVTKKIIFKLHLIIMEVFRNNAMKVITKGRKERKKCIKN